MLQQPVTQPASHGNVLTFTPPGLSQQLNVRFPDSRLAVCAKCKKNFKTRDMCRVRNCHSGPPWTTAYICITIDPSCLDEKGKFVDKPMSVRMIPLQPFCVRKNFEIDTPVCSSCKRTNRTKSFCRERHLHKQLPWCTVYVLLTARDESDHHAGGTVKAEEQSNERNNYFDSEEQANQKESSFERNSKKLKREEQLHTYDLQQGRAHSYNRIHQTNVGLTCEDENDTSERSSPRKSLLTKVDEQGAIGTDSEDVGDDINEIAESRTFLAKVSCRSTSIHWLESSDYDDGHHFDGVDGRIQAQVQHADVIPAMMPVTHYADPSQAKAFYPSAMGYAAQVHHNALKSRQQFFFQTQQQQLQHQLQHGQNLQSNLRPTFHQQPWVHPISMYNQPMSASNPKSGINPLPPTEGTSNSQPDGTPPYPGYHQRGPNSSNELFTTSSQPQQWPMYYPGAPFGPPRDVNNGQAGIGYTATPPQNDQEDDDEKTNKRYRV